MPEVKSLSRISEKWKRQSQAAVPEYEFGVQNPKKDWAEETAKAEENYKRGVIAAANAGSFGKGVRKAGTSKWQQNTLNKGVGRWSEGINVSGANYEEGFKPFRETIQATSLPPRGPKGDPKNIERVRVMAKALHDKKLSLRGSA